MRTSKTERLLLAKEAGLLAEQERIRGELALIADLRRELAIATPKRTRAKRLVPANTQPATATAA